jgi:Leucine-rich repeat (LRR) protein
MGRTNAAIVSTANDDRVIIHLSWVTAEQAQISYYGAVFRLSYLNRVTVAPMKNLCSLFVCLAIFGCSSERQETKSTTNVTATVVTPDDSSAVEALTAVGAKTKKNDGGLIIEVNLRDTDANDETLKAIVPLKHVRSLLLNDLEITDAGLEALKDVDWPISNLDLRGCPVSNTGLSHLTGLSSLKALRLSGSNSSASVDDDGMAAVAQLSNLKVLSLDKLWVSEAGIEQLLPLKNLSELYLAETTIGDDALALFSKLPQLRKLRLARNQISNDGLQHLVGLKDLVELDLSEISLLSDDGLQHLSGLTSLSKLNLWRVPVSDTGIEYLKTLVNLEWLNLDNTQLSDDGLPALVDMKKLTFLHLGSTQVSDTGLKHLSGLTSLKDLKVTRTAVTETGVTELKKSLTTTEIQLEYLGN